MTPDIYLGNVITRHRNLTSVAQAEAVIAIVKPHLNVWSVGYAFTMIPSGSIAKGTAIIGSSDIDILVSVTHNIPSTIQNMYDSMFDRLQMAGFNPRKQNVSIGVQISGLKVDIVPARKHNTQSNDHWLWSHKKQSHRQTNVHQHIRHVSLSGRVNEIILLKIWAKLHNIELPSFVAEMLVINTLSGRSYNNLAVNFWHVLAYINEYILTISIRDPANSNNWITESMTHSEKQAIKNKAADAIRQTKWENIIW